MANEFIGLGAKFNRWDGSQWVPLANITKITTPSPTKDTIDVTTMDDTDGYRRFIGGLRDGGDAGFSMNFDVAAYALLKADFESDTAQDYQIVLNDTGNTTLEFEGIVTGIPVEVPVDAAVTNEITIKVSGKTDLTTVLIIVSVAAINNILAVNGTQLGAVGLPSTATVTYDDTTTQALPVVWNAGTPVYDGASAATYVFAGTITCPTGVINPDAVKAAVSVVVAPVSYTHLTLPTKRIV